MGIHIIGKKGSRAVKDIVDNTSIKRYRGKTKSKGAKLIINYGLASKKLDAFYGKFPSAKAIKTLNKKIGFSKFTVLRKAEDAGIKIPPSKKTLSTKDNLNDWLEKGYRSIGGKGIVKATRKGPRQKKYYQKRIKDRVYELRVHAFNWLPKESWSVQKRIGKPEEIAWNHMNGGVFQTVYNPYEKRVFREAIEIAHKVLVTIGMDFGAVDLIVDEARNIWFIEINSAPGFKELSKPIYLNAFNKLLT